MNKNEPFSSSSLKRRLKTIKCECGLEILVIPDSTEMGRAIEAHAQEHKKRSQTTEEGERIFNHIQDLLLEQVLKMAAKKNDKE